MNGQRLKHNAHPVYLGVALDRTLSYREPRHVGCEAEEPEQPDLKTRWHFMGCQHKYTLHTSTLAVCYSVAEYYCSLWARSSYTDLIDTQPHSSMRLIPGCLRPTQISWLPVLTNVAPSSVRRKAVTDNMLQIIEVHTNWTVHADLFAEMFYI